MIFPSHHGNCIHTSLPPDPTLNHINQTNILTPLIIEIHFSIILPSTPVILKWSLSFIFATKLLPAPHYTILPSFITLSLLKIYNFLQPHYFLSLTLKQFFQALCTSSVLTSNIPLSTLSDTNNAKLDKPF